MLEIANRFQKLVSNQPKLCARVYLFFFKSKYFWQCQKVFAIENDSWFLIFFFNFSSGWNFWRWFEDQCFWSTRQSDQNSKSSSVNFCYILQTLRNITLKIIIKNSNFKGRQCVDWVPIHSKNATTTWENNDWAITAATLTKTKYSKAWKGSRQTQATAF